MGATFDSEGQWELVLQQTVPVPTLQAQNECSWTSRRKAEKECSSEGRAYGRTTQKHQGQQC